jgi:uncharacterized C2H2 Zn-finger protein
MRACPVCDMAMRATLKNGAPCFACDNAAHDAVCVPARDGDVLLTYHSCDSKSFTPLFSKAFVWKRDRVVVDPKSPLGKSLFGSAGESE